MSAGHILQPFHYHPSDGPYDTSGNYGHYFRRDWSGANSSWDSSKRKLILTDNPYSMEFVSETADLGAWSYGLDPTIWTGSTTQFMSSDFLPDPWNDSEELKLQARLVGQVRDHDFNLGTFLGEGRESIKMIADTAYKLASAARSLRKGNVAAAAKHLGVPLKKGSSGRRSLSLGDSEQALSNAWLELQYGWKPLLKDTQSAAEAMANLLNKPMKRRFSSSGSARNSGTTLGGGLFLTKSESVTRKRYTVVLREDYSPIASLGLLDPEVVTWELVPFSFVADWFLPIGTFLETRAHIGRFQGTWVASSKRTTVTSVIPHSSPAITEHNGISTRFRKTVSFSRSISSLPPRTPTPSFKPLNKALSLGHLENGLALLAQAFKGK